MLSCIHKSTNRVVYTLTRLRTFLGVAFYCPSKHGMNSYRGVLTKEAADMKHSAEDGHMILVNGSGRQYNQHFLESFAT